ncbi:A disintegrin and metalloproteinase with thrombospondin motifs 18-like [Mizuhopecten yessoensis]|uniref:A disintegrin and metalloproteinase with thrombospondin motifs 18-like n=1 Tax=Mizuhopecten yessoensis TaxID=6573 RepID=UPI000B457E95|nr:A disintegrin and metalloproteinase with thrombospondin motifs 18-like [Mizuhopecten yessoensis]
MIGSSLSLVDSTSLASTQAVVVRILIIFMVLTPTWSELSGDEIYIDTPNQHSMTEDFDITIPKLYDSEGHYVSHEQLRLHFHQQQFHHPGNRERRDTSYQKPNVSELQADVEGFGHKFQIKLWQNQQLLAPGFKVYRRGHQRHGMQEDQAETTRAWSQSQCQYTGSVTSHNGAPVSISLCDGVSGVIRTAEEDFILEPIKRHRVRGKQGQGQPHKITRRSSQPTDQNQYCGKGSQERTATYSSRTGVVNKTGNQQHSIKKRSPFKSRFPSPHLAPEDKTVETLVVVDKTMYYRHGDENITTYTLTLFNMVADLYKDTSLGNKLDIVLVGLILLEGDETGLEIGNHADKTLNSFCSWQSVLVGPKGRQHDHAILLTGIDLCSYKNAPCDTLGFAPIEGMCNRIRSCTINEDTGLSTAFTIAHEMGHNFGMFHDGEGNYCTQSAGTIMSPTLMGKDGLFHWSICSKAYLMRFLNTPQSDCLSNKPKHVAELTFPEKLPGELYNADIQCKWQFGKRAKLCTYDFGKDICKSLWCYRGKKRCETKFLPAAEGTSCGSGMWCRQGECVRFGQDGPEPIDGQWSEWAEWSDCSRSCGGGVTLRERECNQPLPQYGGRPCQGGDKVFKMCKMEECPEGDEDFYAVQCTSYDKKPFRGWYLKWKPHKKLQNVREPCKLHCIAETFNYVFTITHTAVNGMKCQDHQSICVEGTCKPIGCDLILGSNSSNDACGVCKGDNSTCRRIKGEYTEQPKLNTYFPVAILPKNSRSIRILEKSLTSNYIAIRDIFGKYYLNGQRRVAWPGEYTFGGARFYYRRAYDEPEVLVSTGPLTEDLVIEILVQDHNTGISYEYYMPRPPNDTMMVTETPKTYTWSISVSSCSEPCAGGSKTVTALCHKNLYQEVNSTECNQDEKPETGMFPCNEMACPPRWIPEEWQACTRTCGGGHQKRKIYCRQTISSTKNKKLRRSSCTHLPRPLRSRRCNEQECHPDWHAGKWSKCSVSCGIGERTRKVTCRQRLRKGYKLLQETSCQASKPDIIKTCRKRACPNRDNNDWHLSPWGPCSKTCGRGVRSRYLRCRQKSVTGTRKYVAVNNSLCETVPKPSVAMTEPCQLMICPMSLVWSLRWTVSAWSQCSVTCGDGEQRRQVKCVNHRGEAVRGCDPETKPETSRNCRSASCVQNGSGCLDKYAWCHLVPEHNVCDHDFYGLNCCATCRTRR